MREVTPFIWELWLGDMPMPEGATYEMLEAAREALDAIEREEEAVKGIAYHTQTLEHYTQRLEQEFDPEKIKTLKSIINTVNEILETYRSWLNG